MRRQAQHSGKAESVTAELCAEAIEPYWDRVDDELIEQIQRYLVLLERWKRAVNLTGIRSTREILQFHFGESFFGVAVADVRSGLAVDVGSGNGFPGVAAALIRPQLRVLLLEPSLKKSVFLREAIRELRLEGRCEILHQRYQELQNFHGKVDHIFVRGMALESSFFRWGQRTLADHGKLVLWTSLEKAISIREVAGKSWRWGVPAKIPLSQSRCILVGYPAVE